jgi:hypothetical protein
MPEAVKTKSEEDAFTTALGQGPAGVNAESRDPHRMLKGPPPDRRCQGISGRSGSQCPKWNRPPSVYCAQHDPVDRQSKPASGTEDRPGSVEAFVPRDVDADIETDLAGLATERLKALMDDPNVPAQTRAYAAKALLDRVADEVPPRPRTVVELETLSDHDLDALLAHIDLASSLPGHFIRTSDLTDV